MKKMKKIKFEGKLTLNKETIAKLNDNQMSKVNGGWTWTLINCKSAQCPTLLTCSAPCITTNVTENCQTI